MADDLPDKPRQFQFTIQRLLLLVTGVAVFLGLWRIEPLLTLFVPTAGLVVFCHPTIRPRRTRFVCTGAVLALIGLIFLLKTSPQVFLFFGPLAQVIALSLGGFIGGLAHWIVDRAKLNQ